MGGRLTADETLLLETYATLDTEEIWRLDPDKTLEAIERGHPAKELREFLSSRDDQPLPEKVEGFLRNTERRAQALALRGAALLIECARCRPAGRQRAHCHAVPTHRRAWPGGAFRVRRRIPQGDPRAGLWYAERMNPQIGSMGTDVIGPEPVAAGDIAVTVE